MLAVEVEGDVGWDPRKRERCLAERGIDFLDAIRVFDSAHIELSATSTKEKRIRSVGVVEGRTLTVVWTLRNGVRRIITVWPASRKERRLYHEFIEKDSQNRSPLS
jgi:uncharacterized DUF497 family protein